VSAVLCGASGAAFGRRVFGFLTATVAETTAVCCQGANRGRSATMASISDFSPRVQDALSELVAAIQAETMAAIARGLMDIGSEPATRGPGRPPKALAAVPSAASAVKKFRAPRAPQLCPVPGCKNVAAPAFGMVCSKHKDLPKLKIRKYREARREAKLKAKKGKA
jgi:hypothetical protein